MTGYGIDNEDDGSERVDDVRPKSVTWADPVDDSGAMGDVVRQRATAEASASASATAAKAESGKGEAEDEAAAQGYQIGAVHLYKKQVCVLVAASFGGAGQRAQNEIGGVRIVATRDGTRMKGGIVDRCLLVIPCLQ